MARVWAEVEARFGAYGLAMPGSPAFVCQAETCSAHCCKAFSVPLGEAEVARLAAASGWSPVTFLECDAGEPITLPLAQPYLLARNEGRCTLLDDDLRCSQYHGRPDACRLYPHFIVVIDRESGRPRHGDQAGARAAIATALRGRVPSLVPLLLRHLECPGFTGPPMNEADWRTLFTETAAVQFGRRGHGVGQGP